MLVVLHIVNNRGKAEDVHCYVEENINIERGKLIQKEREKYKRRQVMMVIKGPNWTVKEANGKLADPESFNSAAQVGQEDAS